MNTYLKKTALMGIVASTVALTGCSTTSIGSTDTSRAADLDQRAIALDAREAELAARYANGSSTASQLGGATSGEMGALLPPNAAAGECYARVWVDAEYTTAPEQVIESEASRKIAIIPAVYETVTETVEISAASTRLETIPAVYSTETETIKVLDGERMWRVALGDSAPASDALLNAATAHGIDLDAATPGMCFHEHYLPGTYKTVSEQIVLQPASESVTAIEAEYAMVEETILVKEASTKLVGVEAEYETVTEQILDKPAHTVWKKGTGPIQRIDEATGEIMCLVEVPATYRTVSKTVLKSAARTETVEVPAEYETVQVRKLVSPATEQRNPVAAVYGTVDRKEVDVAGRFVWHEVHNDEHPASTRTGSKICLTETEAQYRKVDRTVVQTPAQTRSIEIPAEFKQVSVTKLVSAAREEVTEIPAVYGSIERRELVRDGYMAWRSILCETNMTKDRIADIQRALNAAGYDVGQPDGSIGANTIKAVNAFQKANDLPVDKYLNIETIKALGVSHQ